ncbi:hypothetical protein ADA01nite_26250 [Aneurinibacillus danicus]|uniref:Uncharacterized protein n=1 Tax=Aneurinibacillus danicus TaxID=267746 RepID=A0A511V880_9BACL|nr:hypothetical protein ADA01nite_26250 [Aneurinibacillus danicus]
MGEGARRYIDNTLNQAGSGLCSFTMEGYFCGYKNAETIKVVTYPLKNIILT